MRGQLRLGRWLPFQAEQVQARFQLTALDPNTPAG
jgi:hypothetical protein